jgi:hypothetical protein
MIVNTHGGLTSETVEVDQEAVAGQCPPLIARTQIIAVHDHLMPDLPTECSTSGENQAPSTTHGEV